MANYVNDFTLIVGLSLNSLFIFAKTETEMAKGLQCMSLGGLMGSSP